MQKIKPEYTPVKRDTPSIEEHETVARKNERKRGIASTARRQPAEACGRQTEPTWRQDALGRGAQMHADGIGPSGRWYCPREASVMWNTGNEKGWREGREKSRIIEADLTHLSRWQIYRQTRNQEGAGSSEQHLGQPWPNWQVMQTAAPAYSLARVPSVTGAHEAPWYCPVPACRTRPSTFQGTEITREQILGPPRK